MKKLVNLRVRVGLTQTDVAKALGVTQGAISAWEQGKKKPTLEKLPAIAKLYGISEQSIVEACMEKPAQSSYYVMRRKRQGITKRGN